MKAVAAAVFIALSATPFCDAKTHSLFQLNERGNSLFVFINGRPAAELQIDRRVSDGKIYIASGLSANDIELLRKDWPTGK